MHVVIAEDSVLLREGLVHLLESGGVTVDAAVGNADSLLRAVERHEPDLALVDVRMPPTFAHEGLTAALLMRRRWPDVAVVVLSHYVEERYATELLSQPTGGIGYLLKDRVADVPQFLESLHRVAAGGTAFDPEVVSQLLVRRDGGPLDRLTPREREVLALMAEGRSNTAIASELVFSESAVTKHVSNIFSKLGLVPADTDHRRVLAVLQFLGHGTAERSWNQAPRSS